MSYIFWRGKDSRDINGLMICELPPITKPKMRVKTETIDGRDGSIITELGYEAYDKTISIGLTKGFDIDEVIDYFSGEGLLNMSNEPDKYYRGKIIDQIDYERLVRFRTAKVKINVQPFKYSATERMKTITPTGASMEVRNNGNTTAKPLIGLYGSGTINLYLNGSQVCVIDLSDGYIALDCENMEAFRGEELKNRKMIGNFPVLKIGKNSFTWTGTITKAEFVRFSRWI